MAWVPNLTLIDSSDVSGLIFVVYSNSNNDAKGLPQADLLTWIDDNVSYPAGFATQYSSPLTGATVTVTDGSDDSGNVHLIVTPAGTIATLTIKLPTYTSCVDKQEILVNSTQIVTALTIDANGADDVKGEPTTLAANGFFRLKLDQPNNIWYRVG